MRRTVSIALSLAALLAAPTASAVSAGIIGNTGKTAGATCALASCHAPGAAEPTVTITGPDSLASGAEGEYTLEITTTLAKGSCGIAVSAGTLSPNSADLRAEGGELTHKASIAATGGKAEFKFKLKAPSSGSKLTIFAVGVGSDGAAQTGDGTKTTTKEISITGGGAATGDDDDDAKTGDDDDDTRKSDDPFSEADATATCATTQGSSSDRMTAGFFALAAIAIALRGSARRRNG